MLISVASGKGGTGKTTVSTNLAYSLGERANLLDCDVDEPNAHLFLNPVFNHKDKAYSLVPEVDKNACTLCRKCVTICRFRAITVVGKSLLVFPEMCHSCGGCFEICPENALVQKERELGDVESGMSGNLAFVQGRLRIGEAMTPPLIRKVRTHIKPDKINIIDAPPGTSCPVIAAMRHADFVLMVTEPTPFGLHDLTLAVETVKILGIPHGIIINRSDMGDNRVRDYALKENIPVLMEIPFDRKIAEQYSKGQLIAEVWPEWKEIFRELFQKIQSCLL
ncbi:MAG: ATP-binding protein [Desulfobacteraceae bacterium]|nr:ATP-binding protein [Desulfobacteraceae bacterium]